MKIPNMDKSTKVKLIIVLFGVILVGLVLLKLSNPGCEIKEYTLLEQELKFDAKCKTMQCLFITVEEENKVTDVLWFESDIYLLNKTFDINVGDKMKIQWCDIKDVGPRVRGISKS